jgi:hypothetical protein
LVEKAKLLLFIDLGELRHKKDKKAKKEIKLSDGAKLTIEEGGAQQDEGVTKWAEWQVLMLELITLYMVQGEHSNKVVQFTTYHRMMLRMGQENVYTYESLIEADTQIRARAAGLLVPSTFI